MYVTERKLGVLTSRTLLNCFFNLICLGIGVFVIRSDQVLLRQPQSIFHARGGQLTWLEGHFEKATFDGGPYLLSETEVSLG